MSIDLVPMTQARLGDSFAALDLIDQAVGVGDQIIVDVDRVPGHHGRQQQSAESGCGISGQNEMTQ
jgi:hypothetical protein